MLAPKVKITTQEDVTILELQGEFVGGGETEDLRDALAQQSKDETKKLLIDLAGARYLNSTALGVLIAAHANFSKRGASVGLCNISKNIENIFVITKLTLVFNIYATREEGVRQMSDQGK